MRAKPVLVIHGGAGSKRPERELAHRLGQSLDSILQEIYPLLLDGLPAIEAAAWAVERLEDDPLYNAGYGSKIQRDGRIRMSASLMDGGELRFGGCVNVERVKNPVRLAQELMAGTDRVLAGRGGESFARDAELEFASAFTPPRRQEFAAWQKASRAKSVGGKTGTVGAVVLDVHGRLAAATSTGGRGFEFPHRVSDTPTVAGNYANASCAVSATGVGEEIVEYAVAARLAVLVESGVSLDKADRDLLRRARKGSGRFGWIAVDRQGRFKGTTATPHLIWAAAAPSGFEIHP